MEHISSSRMRRFAAGAAAAAVAAAAVSGCARFDGADAAPFHAVPDTVSGAGIQPEVPAPGQGTPDPAPPGASPSPTPPAGPCDDPDPAVIATCLDSTGAMVLLPDGQSALVAERTTGRIMTVPRQGTPSEFARIPVDATGDGGLTGLALSPTFGEDHLVYAYITTPEDNRVVRIAQGDEPKTILAGLPKGATGNAGDLAFTAARQLTILTGDAGDPSGHAGRLLRLQDPAPGAQAADVVAGGFGDAGGLCTDAQTGALWITDRTPTMDRLQRLTADGTVPTLVWSWPDRPGVGGCAAGDGTVVTALDGGKAVAAVTVSKDSGAVTGDPIPLAADRYGRFGAALIDGDGTVWGATVNKAAGEAAATDDRVVVIPFSGGGGSRV